MKINDKILLRPGNFIPSIKGTIVRGAFNPGAIRLDDGRILLYVRVAEGFDFKGKILKFPRIVTKDYGIEIEEIPKRKIKGTREVFSLPDRVVRLKTISHFRKVILDKTGMAVEEIDEKPSFIGTPEEGDYGVEDARIVKIGNEYLMTYVAVSFYEDVSTCLAVSKDLVNWERKGIIFRKQNKDVIIFPEKINGNYVALHRPQGDFEFHGPSIWISHSKDLVHWGEEKSVMWAREDSFDSERLGAGPPPIKTKHGWLLLYHGTQMFGNDRHYNVGAVLLNLKDPSKVLARSPPDKPLIIPEKPHEIKGFVKNVVFPTGLVLDLNGKDLLLYSGATDTYTTVRKIPLDYIFKNLKYYK